MNVNKCEKHLKFYIQPLGKIINGKPTEKFQRNIQTIDGTSLFRSAEVFCIHFKFAIRNPVMSLVNVVGTRGFRRLHLTSEGGWSWRAGDCAVRSILAARSRRLAAPWSVARRARTSRIARATKQTRSTKTITKKKSNLFFELKKKISAIRFFLDSELKFECSCHPWGKRPGGRPRS